ncbi:MAG: hypothetical protein P8I03_13985 [Thalassotalea sp.]|nr:hypothetical protein [Thalassotalea sp.]
MDSSTPFYQQLSARLLTIFAVSLLTLILALLMLQYRDQQVITLIEKQLPAIENSYQQQAKYIEINELLTTIIHDTNAKDLLENHQLYLTHLGELKSLSGKQTRLFEQLILLEKAEQENIKRLTNNHQRNLLLRQNSVIQLQLVLDELNGELLDKEAKQAKLFQQITQDKVADKVTASRAKAHANLTQEVNILRQTALAVKNVEVLFSRINLQYSLDEFNFFSDELSVGLALWKPQFDEVENSAELTTPLIKVMLKLEQLLFSEQNAIAKWRGQLRLSQEYFQRLSNQQVQLQAARNQLKLPTSSVRFMPKYIEELLGGKVTFTIKQLQITILLIFAFLMMIVWILLSKLKKRIKEQNLASIHVVENILSGKSVEESSYSSAEEQQLATLVSNTVQPKHSENDYQLIENHLQNIQQSIFEQAQLAFYTLFAEQISKGTVSERKDSEEKIPHGNKLAQQLIFAKKALSNKVFSNKESLSEVVNKNWQDAFSFTSLKTIIHTARKAKRDNTTAQCEVLNRFNKLITITIIHKDDLWQGTVSVHEKKTELVRHLEKLEQQLISQQAKYQKSFANNADKLSNMLIRTMLQSQSVSIGSGVTSLQVYRQLTRILDWSRQLQINTELQRDENIKTYTDVDTKNELFAISQNIMVEANQQRNTVQLRIDSHLMSRAKVNVSILHRTLVGISRLCLLEEFKSTLLIDAYIVDKNSGQQIIRFTFNILSNKPKAGLPELITAFIDYDGQENAVQKIQYLHTLLAATYCKNLIASMTEQGFKLSIDMPLAYAESTAPPEKEIQAIDFKETEFFVVGKSCSLIKNIEKQVEAANGKIESIEQVDHLIKQLSVKHLTAHQVGAVIVTAQVFKNDGQLINQHLNALPKPMTPKLLVLQSSFTHALHNEGFFEYTDSPCESLAFIEYLAKFIKTERTNNLLIPAEVFSQHRFSSTQVEVLLAVESPEKYQQLSRLLYWLGLQVHVVCQAETMQSYWQTGRYLVLMSEFQSSPFIEMKVGKNVSRGVFSLAKTPFNKPTKKELAYTQSWHLEHVINLLDIQYLIKIFSPWLKEKQLVLSPERKEKISRKIPTIVEKTDNKTGSVKANDNEDKLSNVDSLVAVQGVELHQAFDLNLYAIHQGSPELAVFMLDDYVAEINDAITAIPIAIKDKAFSSALEHAAEIEKLTTILAAKDLNESAKALTVALNKKAVPEVNAKLKLLTQQYQVLNEFVQTI